MKNKLEIVIKEIKNIFMYGAVIFVMAAVFLPFLTLAVKALLWIFVKTWNLI